MSKGYRCRRDLQFFATGDQNKNSVPCLSLRTTLSSLSSPSVIGASASSSPPFAFSRSWSKKVAKNSILSFGDDLMPIMLLVFTACYEIQHVGTKMLKFWELQLFILPPFESFVWLSLAFLLSSPFLTSLKGTNSQLRPPFLQILNYLFASHILKIGCSHHRVLTS